MKRLIKARVKSSKCEVEKSNNRGEVIKQFISIGTLILTFTTFLLSAYNTYMNMYTSDTQNNRKGCNKNMNSKIIYYVKADYLYINDSRKSKDFIISRYSNSINPFTESKLYFDDDLLKTFQRAKQHNTVECSKALYEFEKIYYEPEPSCFRDPTQELIDGLNNDVYSFIEKVQSEYGLDVSAEQYDNQFSL